MTPELNGVLSYIVASLVVIGAGWLAHRIMLWIKPPKSRPAIARAEAQLCSLNGTKKATTESA